MAFSSTIRTLSSAVAVTTLLAVLVACGSDSVDNSTEGTTSATVPSVTGSATAKADKDAKDSKSSKKNDSEKSGSHNGNGANGSAPQAQDGSVKKVEEVPQDGGRAEADEKFLKKIKDGGVDLNKAGADRVGLEDSLISAAVYYCKQHERGEEDFLLPLAAGQLKTLGAIDGNPQEAEKVLVNAAKSAYCQ